MYNGSPAMAGYMGRIKHKVSASPKDFCRAGINARAVSGSLSRCRPCRVCAERTHAAGITRATWHNGQRRARLRRTPYTPPTAADKSDEERLPENSGSLCVADKCGGLKAQAGADAEVVRAVGGRIEMGAGVVAGMGFVMLVAVIRAEGQRQIRGKLFLRIHTQS